MTFPRLIIRTYLTAGFFVLSALIAFSASAETIEIELSDGAPPIRAYIYKPSGKGPFPGVFVLHQGTGFKDSVKDFSNVLSKKGFVIIAVDFSSRPWHDAHFGAAYDYLKKLPQVKERRIGWVGFSKGARLGMGVVSSWKNETPPRPIRAFISYYIGNSIDTMPTSDLPPILFLHGADDERVDADMIPMFCGMQRDLGGTCEAKIYSGVRHAFDYEDAPSRYDSRATADAFKRTVDFLNKYLRDAPIQ